MSSARVVSRGIEEVKKYRRSKEHWENVPKLPDRPFDKRYLDPLGKYRFTSELKRIERKTSRHIPLALHDLGFGQEGIESVERSRFWNPAPMKAGKKKRSTQMKYFDRMHDINVALLGGSCSVCGSNEGLHIHESSYPFGKSSGGKNRIFKIQKAINAGYKGDLVLLCDKHHKMVRNNIIKPQKTIIRARNVRK